MASMAMETELPVRTRSAVAVLAAWSWAERRKTHGDAGQSADDKAILHNDLGAILRRQMPGGG